jgi:hypothetical protein
MHCRITMHDVFVPTTDHRRLQIQLNVTDGGILQQAVVTAWEVKGKVDYEYQLILS